MWARVVARARGRHRVGARPGTSLYTSQVPDVGIAWGTLTMRLEAFGIAIPIALGVASCASPTEMTLHITTNVPCSVVEEQGVSVAAGDPASIRDRFPAMQARRCAAGPAVINEVGHLVIVPSGAKDAEVAIRVVLGVDVPVESCTAASGYKGCIVSRFLLPFIERQNLNLEVRLAASCKGVLCDDLTTCASGVCVSARVDVQGCRGPEGCAPHGVGSGDAGTDGPFEPSDDGGGDARAASGDGGPDAPTTDSGVDSGSFECPPYQAPPRILNRCTLHAQACCQSFTTGVCAEQNTSSCPGAYVYQCGGASDCSTDRTVCCAGRSIAQCLTPTDCAASGGAQLCTGDGECPSGACAPRECTTGAPSATMVTFSTCGKCPM